MPEDAAKSSDKALNLIGDTLKTSNDARDLAGEGLKAPNKAVEPSNDVPKPPDDALKPSDVPLPFKCLLETVLEKAHQPHDETRSADLADGGPRHDDAHAPRKLEAQETDSFLPAADHLYPAKRRQDEHQKKKEEDETITEGVQGTLGKVNVANETEEGHAGETVDKLEVHGVHKNAHKIGCRLHTPLDSLTGTHQNTVDSNGKNYAARLDSFAELVGRKRVPEIADNDDEQVAVNGNERGPTTRQDSFGGSLDRTIHDTEEQHATHPESREDPHATMFDLAGTPEEVVNSAAREHAAELVGHEGTHQAELDKREGEHHAALETLENAHQAQLHSLKDAIKALESKHAEEVVALKGAHKRDVERLEATIRRLTSEGLVRATNSKSALENDRKRIKELEAHIKDQSDKLSQVADDSLVTANDAVARLEKALQQVSELETSFKTADKQARIARREATGLRRKLEATEAKLRIACEEAEDLRESLHAADDATEAKQPWGSVVSDLFGDATLDELAALHERIAALEDHRAETERALAAETEGSGYKDDLICALQACLRTLVIMTYGTISAEVITSVSKLPKCEWTASALAHYRRKRPPPEDGVDGMLAKVARCTGAAAKGADTAVSRVFQYVDYLKKLQKEGVAETVVAALKGEQEFAVDTGTSRQEHVQHIDRGSTAGDQTTQLQGISGSLEQDEAAADAIFIRLQTQVSDLERGLARQSQVGKAPTVNLSSQVDAPGAGDIVVISGGWKDAGGGMDDCGTSSDAGRGARAGVVAGAVGHNTADSSTAPADYAALQAEITALQTRLAERETQMADVTRKHADILREHTAMEAYIMGTIPTDWAKDSQQLRDVEEMQEIASKIVAKMWG